MVPYPRLPKPPIREALIDFRVHLPERSVQSHREVLRSVADAVAGRYPSRSRIHHYQGEFQVKDGTATSVQHGPQLVGYRLESPDGLNVAQVRLDGFTFSRLAPYDSWESLTGEAFQVWQHYVENTIPLGVVRVATRFVNRIVLPASGQLGRVFREPPRVAVGQIDSLFLRYQLAPRDGVTAIVSLATEESDQAAMIFDIDCFVRKPLPADPETLVLYLDRVRNAKNRVFFGTLTRDWTGVLDDI